MATDARRIVEGRAGATGGPGAAGASRRGFLGAGSTAALAAGLMVHSSVPAAEGIRDLRLAVVGCGGRGAGAVDDSLSINEGVTLVSAADLYVAKCAGLREAMSAAHEGKVAIDDSRMYGGLDGYRRVLDDPTVDVVLFTTSPGFRPRHLREAVEAGKHVFAEKPTCVDPAGYRICLEAHDRAVAQGTGIVTGTQYRRQTNYVGAIEQIHAGAIGRIIGGTARYCASGIWYRPRLPAMSDAEYQLNNWYHFVWLSGDQIVEQAVHTIDTLAWVMGANPVSAFGSGGRFTQTADSSLAAVLGRVAAYTGRKVTWDFLARDSTLDLFPPDLDWKGDLPQQKPAVPGKTRLLERESDAAADPMRVSRRLQGRKTAPRGGHMLVERPPSSFASPLRPPGRRYGKTESALAVGRARRAASSSGR